MCRLRNASILFLCPTSCGHLSTGKKEKQRLFLLFDQAKTVVPKRLFYGIGTML